MKDDSGSYAVFTEQGPSASQMTAAKVMDVIARPQDCAGQAADAVSADTLVNMQDAPTLLKIPKPEYPDRYGFVFHNTNGPNLGQTLKTQWFISNEICTVTPLAGLLWERQLEKVPMERAWEKISKLGMLIRKPRKRTILVCVRGRYKIGWKETEH